MPRIYFIFEHKLQPLRQKAFLFLQGWPSSKKQQGEYSTTSSFNKRSQTTMPAACQNYTQLKPTNKTSYVSRIWDGGYGRVKIVFHQAPIYLSERLHLYHIPSRQLPLFYRHPIVFRIPTLPNKVPGTAEKKNTLAVYFLQEPNTQNIIKRTLISSEQRKSAHFRGSPLYQATE